MSGVTIAVLEPSAQVRSTLGDILSEAVADGASVSFMHPVAPQAAETFWTKALAAAARGERVLLGAWDAGALIGTVTLLLDCADNQPHRAEIAKLIVRPSHRGRGIATALMRAAEAAAVARGRSLLVLDTAEEGGAAGLYEGLGFQLAGRIPDYAFKPHGGLNGTLIYFKRVGAAA
jgi:ribosomal protein S18 acetylase RimI-like enzyme